MENVKYNLKNGIAIITLNRPESLNALNDELKRELNKLLINTLRDANVRVIILTGEGRGFCAGGDVKAQATRTNDLAIRRETLKELNQMILEITKSSKPIISAVNGFAVGAGLGLALAADLIVASSNAKFSAPFIKLGLVSDSGVSYLATRRIGVEKTKRLLLTGETLDTHIAEQWGLVDWVVEPEDLLSFSINLAGQIVDSPQMVVEMTKTMLANIQYTPIDDALNQELNNQSICSYTEEHKERVMDFIERKK